jgi:protein-tyrosine kinase
MSSDNKQQPTTIARLVEASGQGEAGVGPADNNNPSTGADTGRWGSENNRKVDLLERLRELNMLVPGSDLTREIQDDYRRVKRPLVSNAVGKNKLMVERGNLILVTSSLPGEGKTYTSLNLALSIAQEMDTTVLLVDCDVARHGLSRMLGIENYSGLVEVLEDKSVSVGDVMLQTDVPTLSVMSAGKQHEYVTELLASDRMAALADEIVSRYTDRIIIFDGPPLLPTPQTQVIAGLVGQVVFVIETGKTPRALVEEALELIPEDQAVGLVLNKNEGLSGRGTYYYGYYGPVDQ